MKKKPLIITLSVAALILLIYTGAWMYCLHFIWLPHLPDQSKIDRVETEKAWTYYYLKEDEDGYLFRMLVPSFSGFLGSHCVLDAVSCMAINETDGNDDFETGSRYREVISNFSFIVACPLNSKCEIKSFGFVVNAAVPDDDCAAAACFNISPDLELENKEELTAAELKLYQAVLPEIERVCKKFHELFSV